VSNVAFGSSAKRGGSLKSKRKTNRKKQNKRMKRNTRKNNGNYIMRGAGPLDWCHGPLFCLAIGSILGAMVFTILVIGVVSSPVTVPAYYAYQSQNTGGSGSPMDNNIIKKLAELIGTDPILINTEFLDSLKTYQAKIDRVIQTPEDIIKIFADPANLPNLLSNTANKSETAAPTTEPSPVAPTVKPSEADVIAVKNLLNTDLSKVIKVQ
jgi:hypothetical protein